MTGFEIFTITLFSVVVLPFEITKWVAIVKCIKLSKEYDECD